MKIKEKIAIQTMNEPERCVLCGCETSYTYDIPVDMRRFYVSGCGQLCENCNRQIKNEGNCVMSKREFEYITRKIVRRGFGKEENAKETV